MSVSSDIPQFLELLEVLMPGGAKPPDHFQALPPGDHMCRAEAKKASQSMAGWTAIRVHAGTADVLQRSLEQHAKKAADGKGPTPWIDFNHRSEEAAAHVLGFSWAKEATGWMGGVRIHVRWSLAGALAVLGGTYTRFSPSILLDSEEVNEVSGTFACCGGLTNDPGFRGIAPILPPDGFSAATFQATNLEDIKASAERFERITDAVMKAAELSRRDAIAAARVANPSCYLDWLRWISDSCDVLQLNPPIA